MGYTLTEVNNFINRMAPYIYEESICRGYKICSTVIAQAIIEGAAGTSSLARVYHNHFGMKCGSSWKGKSVNLKTKEEYKVGTLTTIKDNFRVYDSDREGIVGYYDFISTKRYANLKNATSYKEYAEMLKADGYATSSSYVNTLCSTVEKYNLQRFDSIQPTDEIPLHIAQRRTLKRGMNGSDVLYVQQILQEQMYDIGKYGCDGQFGSCTEKAVKQFQSEKGLVADGIIGVKTWTMLEKYS